MKEFDRDDLKFLLPRTFKSLSKKYILEQIFDEELQARWEPQVGDIIVTNTGNIFVISGNHVLSGDLGGELFFFGGGLCTKDGSNIMNETYSYTMNKSGKWLEEFNNDEIKQNFKNAYHSSFKDFRFVPYPHELELNIR